MLKHNVLVCIIILNWNGLKNTINCLNSLLSIRYANNKIIVVDNGSLKNEAYILKKSYGNKIDTYRLNENLGFTGGTNFGIKKALKYNPDFILLLNNDTLVDKNFLKYLIDSALSDKKIGIASPVIYDYYQKNIIQYSGGSIYWLFSRPYHLIQNIKQTSEINWVTGCCLLLKKEVVDKVKLLDDRFFAYFEDISYCLKAIKAGYKCVCVPKSKIYHLQTGSSNRKGKFYTYLMLRNRILFVNNYTPVWYKAYFFIFNFFKLLAVQIYFITTRQNHRAYAFLKGYIDGNLGIGGKPKI